jgi:hypothetical protein
VVALPFERAPVVEAVADLERDDAALRRQLAEQGVAHRPGDVVEVPEPMVGGHDRVGGDLEGLLDRLVGGVRDVDDHAQSVHLPDDGSAAVVQSTPSPRRAAGIGEPVRPVVGGELQRAEAQPMELSQDAEVAIEVEAAFEVEDGGELPGGVDASDVGGGQRQLDRVLVPLELLVRRREQAQHLAGLVAGRVVLLGDEEAEEERVVAALSEPRQVDLAVLLPLPQVAAAVEVAVHDVDVGVEHEGVAVQRAGAVFLHGVRRDQERRQRCGEPRHGSRVYPAERHIDSPSPPR